MCILFVYVAPKGSGKYRLILASNRDEDFSRPSKSAEFWNELIFGGRDMTPGKEGGTWLAASRSGKVGVLLNYVFASSDSGKKARGFIVNDFLSSPVPTSEYMEHLRMNGDTYNPFHFVTVDMKEESPLRYFCNVNPITKEYNSGCHAFCNSTLNRPYMKASVGREKFQSVVDSFTSEEELVSNLLALLRDETKHYPDPVIDDLPSVYSSVKNSISSIFVNAPSQNYGTRTNTIILVTSDNEMEFFEWTLQLPMRGSEKVWERTETKFVII